MANKKTGFSSIGGFALFLLLGQLLTFFREILFANYFGTNVEMDAYVIATQIPITLFVIVGVSITTVVLPMYTNHLEKCGKSDADRLLNNIICLVVLLGIVLSSAGIIYTNVFVQIFAPDFSTYAKELMIEYLRILFPTIILTSVINILTVVYYSHDDFLLPVIFGQLQNFFIVIGLMFCGNKYGMFSIVIFTALGIMANWLFIVLFISKRFKFQIVVRPNYDDWKIILSRLFPVIIGASIAEINTIIDRMIASGLPEGSVSALSYANKLTVAFTALILSAVSTVAYKKFSELYIAGKDSDRIILLNKYLSILVLILLPVTMGIFLLKKELMIIIFGRGVFNAVAIDKTTQVFLYYSLGIVFIAVREILCKWFYAIGNTRTPMINTGISIIINIILNIYLSKIMGASGLALATTLSNCAVCFLLALKLHTTVSCFNLAYLKQVINKSLLATFIMGGAVYITYIGISGQHEFEKLVLCTLVGIISYALLIITIMKKQMRELIHLVFEKFVTTQVPTIEN